MCAKFITFDGKRLALDDSSVRTLGDAFKQTNTPYADGLVIGIVKGRRTQRLEAIKEYGLYTNKGEIRVEIDEQCKSLWIATYQGFAGCKVHWAQPQIVSIGPVPSTVAVDRAEREYERWDITYSLGGFDQANTYLSFIKKRHSASYGTNIVFGKAIAGKNVLEKLEHGDEIQRIEPIERLERITDKFTTLDLDVELEDGMEIYTHFKATLSKDASEGAEHFLALVKDGYYRVDATTNTYVLSTHLQGRSCPFEMLDARGEGAITVRTSGRNYGNVYIYKRDTPSNSSHSVIGYVSEGLELIKIAHAGQRLRVYTDPTRIMFLGLTYPAIEKQTQKLGIDLEKEGYTGKDAVVVRQFPLNTVDILKAKSVRTYAMPENKLVPIELYEERAPKTVAYIRTITGLRDNPVGSLEAYVKYGKTIMFRAQTPEKFDIAPENTPVTTVPATEIGVSNRSSKYAGIIGVRLEDNEKYGPTGERFNSTNIVGRILHAETLKDIKENEAIYVYEAR
ncbi:MAG: methanogenesis marker 3 protein [Euryarchaeota archaeon]|nr:methanogenesis marker 3 protein [Euryarchaeota archaeon]